MDHPETITSGPRAIPESSTLASPLNGERTWIHLGLAHRKENLAAPDRGGSEYARRAFPCEQLLDLCSLKSMASPAQRTSCSFSAHGRSTMVIWCFYLLTIFISFVRTSFSFPCVCSGLPFMVSCPQGRHGHWTQG